MQKRCCKSCSIFATQCRSRCWCLSCYSYHVTYICWCWYRCSSDDWCRECIQLHKSKGNATYNLKSIYLIITTYIINCYVTPSRLFAIDGAEIISSKGTIQGDPTAVEAYALDILPLIKFLLEFINLRNEC